MIKTPNALGTEKVRRATIGSKRAPGWEWQKSGRRVRRADVRELKRGPDDPSLSGVGGLVDFNAFVQRERLGRRLAHDFGHLKTGKQVVYPMHTQIQLLIDAVRVGDGAGAKHVEKGGIITTNLVVLENLTTAQEVVGDIEHV